MATVKKIMDGMLVTLVLVSIEGGIFIALHQDYSLNIGWIMLLILPVVACALSMFLITKGHEKYTQSALVNTGLYSLDRLTGGFMVFLGISIILFLIIGVYSATQTWPF